MVLGTLSVGCSYTPVLIPYCTSGCAGSIPPAGDVASGSTTSALRRLCCHMRHLANPGHSSFCDNRQGMVFGSLAFRTESDPGVTPD